MSDLPYQIFCLLIESSKGNKKLGMVTHTCSLSTWKAELGGLGIQHYPWLNHEFEARDGYMKPCVRSHVSQKVNE